MRSSSDSTASLIRGSTGRWGVSVLAFTPDPRRSTMIRSFLVPSCLILMIKPKRDKEPLLKRDWTSCRESSTANSLPR